MKQIQPPNAEIQEATARLMDQLIRLRRGEVLPYTEIEKIIGIPRKKNRFRTVLNKCRNIMLKGENGIETKMIANVGLLLMHIPEQVYDSPIRRRRKIVSQHKKAINGLFGAARSALDERQQKYLAQEMASQEQQLKEESNHIRLLRAVQPMEQPLHKRRE